MKGRSRIIRLYLARSTIEGFLLALSLLVMLFSLFELLVQLDFVGRGAYRLADAFVFVALTVPKRLSDLTPMAALLGSTFGLGLLADHQELTAMQAAGISVRRIALSVLATSVLLMLSVFLVSELIAPRLEQQARIKRTQAIYDNKIMLTRHGFWSRHGQLYVHVGRTFSGGGASDIEVFDFDDKGLLRQFIFAATATIESGMDWVLTDAEATVFIEKDIVRKILPEYRIKDFLSSSQVAVLELPPDSLSLSDLYTYIRTLKGRELNAERYSLAFYQKISLPVTTGVMVLLSLSFIFGSTRMRNVWQRISVGMLAGTLIYLANQVLGQFSLAFHLPPLLMTLMPTGIIFLVSLKLLRRTF